MTLTKLIFLAIILTIISGSFETKYKGIVGNVCEKTTENPRGYCYEQLPQRGFPIAYIKDKGGVSVVGRLGVIDDFELPRFIFANLANILIYLSILCVLFFMYKKYNIR